MFKPPLLSRAILFIFLGLAVHLNAQDKDSANTLIFFEPGADSSKTPLQLRLDSLERKQKENRTLGFVGDSLYKSPWGAVGRSLIFPGLGQIYNEQPLKAGLFAAADVSMLVLYHQKDKKVTRIENKRKTIDRQLKNDPFLSDEQRRLLSSRFNALTGDLDDALNSRNLYGWFFALSHLLSLVDAYVDAHLFNFKDKMELAYIPQPDGLTLAMRIRW